MMNKAPGTRVALKGINELLAKAINATKVTETVVTASGVFTGKVWQLANGTKILVESATSSLLQGIALSTVGTTILSAPAVVAVIKAVKKLTNKTKNLLTFYPILPNLFHPAFCFLLPFVSFSAKHPTIFATSFYQILI